MKDQDKCNHVSVAFSHGVTDVRRYT